MRKVIVVLALVIILAVYMFTIGLAWSNEETSTPSTTEPVSGTTTSSTTTTTVQVTSDTVDSPSTTVRTEPAELPFTGLPINPLAPGLAGVALLAVARVRSARRKDDE